MGNLGWNNTILAKAAGLSSPSIVTRMLENLEEERTNRNNAENLFLMLRAMGFLKKGGNKGMEERDRERYDKQIAMYERHIERLEKQLDARMAPMTEEDEFVRKRGPGED